MVAIKLKHSDLAQHQASIFKQLHTFRKEGLLCDMKVKSCDGKEHQAHKAVLGAASEDLKNMLVGPFHEANQVQKGQPVEMAASAAVVFALLEYIYGEEPQVELEDAFELLRLADAYNFSHLAATVQASLHSCLDSASVATALRVLQQTQGLHDLQDACEEKVAANFEHCIELVDFLTLSAGQLGRILRRPDLRVSREEVVVKALLNWFKRSNDRGGFGALLQNIDFQCLSSDNLARLRHHSASMGPAGHDLQREVGEALQVHKKRSAAKTPDTFRPKRRCLQHWSPELGASLQAARRVLLCAQSLCCHNGNIYSATCDHPNPSSILTWKPGDESQVVAGRGARVNRVNDLGPTCMLSVSPEGNIFVADRFNERLLRFENGSGSVVLSDVAVQSVSCSPNGAVYLLTQGGRAVEKLVDGTLQPLISSEHLPAELQFQTDHLFAIKDEAIYLSDWVKDRVLRIKPGETEPVVVGELPKPNKKGYSNLEGLFVTEEKKIYVADYGQRKVWAFHPGDAAWTEALVCPEGLKPTDVLVQGRSLYVSMVHRHDANESGVYEYLLPPDLQLG